MAKVSIFIALLSAFSPFIAEASTESSAAASNTGGFNFRLVSPGIYRSARPRNEEKMRFLVSQGVRNIVNLQGRGSTFQPGEKPHQIAESERIALSLGMGYLKNPTTVGEDHALTPEEKAEVLTAVSYLRNPALQPILVHCFFGADRTGVVIASYRILAEGCSFEKARDEMYREGYGLTENTTRGQLPFLQELTTRERPDESHCPLP